MRKYVVFIISIFFCFINFVSAEENKCTYDLKNSLTSEGLKVTVSYDFIKDENGQYFKFNIYNITPNIFVKYNDSNGESKFAFSNNAQDGVVSFYDYNTDNIFRYNFEVYTVTATGCNFKITTKMVIKPKKNPYFELQECKYEKMKDFYYCKEWIENDFLISEEQILKSINDKVNETSTTKKVTEEEEETGYLTFKEIYIMSRKYIIIGLVIGIIVDVYCLYLSFRKVRDNIL